MYIDKGRIRAYIERFNDEDEEIVMPHIANRDAWAWMEAQIPFFECPDQVLEETYYFRWWVYRKHIKKTEAGYIMTEFQPDVPWAGAYNAIVCPAGHQLYEGRWLADPSCLEDYVRYWYLKGGARRAYSNWLGDGLWQFVLVTGNERLATDLLDHLVEDYEAWEQSNKHESGLFWSNDDRDGMEFSISGNGLRPTLNAYMFGYARMIARTASLAGRQSQSARFEAKAAELRELINAKLWDPADGHYKTYPLSRREDAVNNWAFESIPGAVNVREQIGFVPWYFDVPPEGRERAWRQLRDREGFHAAFGPTTAERRHPRYRFEAEHECLWNGPSWPFATAMTLTALANVLQRGEGPSIGKADYYELLSRYAGSHYRKQSDGTVVHWLDENLDPDSGDWLSRSILEEWGWKPEKGGRERGKDYNHSSFCDLVITGLVGLRPSEGGRLTVNPLVPEHWPYFLLQDVPYRGKRLTVCYDKDGSRYGIGAGMHVYADGECLAYAPEVGKLEVETVQSNKREHE